MDKLHLKEKLMNGIFKTIMWKRIFYRALLLPAVAVSGYAYSINWLLWVCAFIAVGLFSEYLVHYAGVRKKKTVYGIWTVFLGFIFTALYFLPDWKSALILGGVFGTASISLYWSLQQYKWVLNKMSVQKHIEPADYEKIKEAYKFDVSAICTESGRMKFIRSQQPVTEAITKFGGQPVWIDTPQWPLGEMSGKPMRFIGQIKLEEKLFGTKKAQMAYLFYSEGIDDNTDTFEIEGGENAVILQPGTPLVPVVDNKVGPRIEDIHDESKKCEFEVTLTYKEEPSFIPEHELWELPDKESEKYYKATKGNKLGGVPNFIQADEFPDNSPWQLLMQMDDEVLPDNCHLNFGVGVAYAMINPDGTKARFFWQC